MAIVINGDNNQKREKYNPIINKDQDLILRFETRLSQQASLRLTEITTLLLISVMGIAKIFLFDNATHLPLKI